MNKIIVIISIAFACVALPNQARAHQEYNGGYGYSGYGGYGQYEWAPPSYRDRYPPWYRPSYDGYYAPRIQVRERIIIRQTFGGYNPYQDSYRDRDWDRRRW